MKVFKAVRGMNFIAVVMYRSQQRSRRGQRIVTSQSQEVASFLLRFTRRGSYLFFWLLAKKIDGFHLAFSPCRVQGKPKVACFFIVLLYVHIEILAVLVPVI